MPKPKQFIKESKKKSSKHALQTPETADEYLAAGVDFEEAGEKWRAGDAAKSTRFFVRAIDLYEEALKKFPNSFDLAYNKARVQFELTQHPRLLKQLPASLLDLLKTALDSSRYALSLRQDNAEILFNTAQVLTSLVEAVQDDRSGSVSKEDSLRLLEEAIELFQRCLVLQEYQFAESQTRNQATGSDASFEGQSVVTRDPADTAVTLPTQGHDSEYADKHWLPDGANEDQWALLVEPVTNDALLDTVLAQLETLALLCSLIYADEGRGLAWIEEYSTELLNKKLPAYVQGTDREDEAAMTRVEFIVSLADANFRSRRIDVGTYERALEEAYCMLDLKDDPEGLCNRAEALMTYNSSQRLLTEDPASTGASRWKALTAALEALTAASKLPSADNLAKIHLARGDVELLRFQLGNSPTSYDIAIRNADTLVKNAGTFYRGAEAHGVAAKLVDETQEAVIKAALTASILGQGEKLIKLMKTEPQACQRVLEEALEEGLITVEWLRQGGMM